MPIQKLIFICIVFASALLGSVFAADKPVAQADMDMLQDQVRTLDKELAVQREAFVRKLDDVAKRKKSRRSRLTAWRQLPTRLLQSATTLQIQVSPLQCC